MRVRTRLPFMKCPFKVGDRIQEFSSAQFFIKNKPLPVKAFALGPPATVTEITKKGFKYKYDRLYVMHARLNLVVEGGECFKEGFGRFQLIPS